ncbi:sensor histidine kinase [Gracilimonas sp.]|uniref:sensor histidine kinase n=1 Tax=Gracilimonas sp. TaxID=1974203 RepID=UPI002872074E|nr:HAMP domain-containing sensor histidine kinase [Gracilimonas sp.]
MYKDAGNAEQALYHHERYKSLSDSLNQVQQDNELANLESQLELNRQTEINQLLEEKQAQQEARIQFQMIMIVAGGVILLLIGILLYTTRKSSKEKEQLLEKVRAQKGELEEMNKSKEQVFAMVSHDLRSPLTSVQGVIELIRDDALKGKDLKKLIDSIEVSIRENVHVIEDLLAWAKDQLSGFDLNLQNVELKPIAKDVLTTNSFMAIQKNITLESSFNGEAVYADPNAIRVILRNLISNAIKYSESGGTVQVLAEEKSDKILLLVRDDGVGVPESSKDKIFNGNSWTRIGTNKEHGSGFGLNMSKEFVEKMEGKIWFESKEGEGTTFYVELPKSN